MDLSQIKQLVDYDNILVTDQKGYIIFCEVAELKVLRMINSWPEDIIGKHITSFYQRLSEEDSTIMRALKYGKATIKDKQTMTTHDGKDIISISSTFPLLNDNKVAGAIEFSKHYYPKETISALDKKQTHQIYRKNNTIYTIEDFISQDLLIDKIKTKMKKIALNNSATLIHGETGTGKEIVAQSIHNASTRFVYPFISLNCSAVPETLVEGILFGTVKGSFTGAENRKGILEEANKGTLFLDEVNSLPMHIQVKLLKAIEEKVIRRVGGTQNIYCDFSLISAMNENPEQLIAEKRLRQDLYYRLNVTEIELPPLRERRGDIKLLVDYFINFYNDNMFTPILEIAPNVMSALEAYAWPGNVRELKNAIETAYNSISSTTLTLEDFPERIVKYKQDSEAKQTLALSHQVDAFEKEMILKALEHHHGVYAAAADELKISRQSFQYKLKKHGIK